jgi:hypothetical protein
MTITCQYCGHETRVIREDEYRSWKRACEHQAKNHPETLASADDPLAYLKRRQW